jgi:serine/threonine-protein kinase HipA
MQLARAAGVRTADCELVPMDRIMGDIELHHGSGKHFLSVKRFDRDASPRHLGYTQGGRLHMEDFCQVLGTAASAKYNGSALQIMAVLAGLGRHADVEELVRRWVVNELLGNFDAHLKNYSLLYVAPQSPVLSPAYDIVAYSLFHEGRGAALRWLPSQRSVTPLSKAVLKTLLEHTQTILQNAGLHTPLTLQRLTKIAAQTQTQALDTWPAMLPNLPLSAVQAAKLTARFAKVRGEGVKRSLQFQ